MLEFGAALDGATYAVIIVAVLAFLLLVANPLGGDDGPYRHSDDKGPIL